MEISEDLRAKCEPILRRSEQTLGGRLGFSYRILTRDCVVASMPVNDATKQPFGLLHGGASVALAESLASIGAWLNVDDSLYDVVGMEINANHIRAVRDGLVVGTARPIHRGAKTQVWEVRIETEEGSKLVCISRCTLAVIPKLTSN